MLQNENEAQEAILDSHGSFTIETRDKMTQWLTGLLLDVYFDDNLLLDLVDIYLIRQGNKTIQNDLKGFCRRQCLRNDFTLSLTFVI